jgi:hypothetical protein
LDRKNLAGIATVAGAITIATMIAAVDMKVPLKKQNN